ncbi:MAG: cobalt transporter CbiM [Rhodospirillales bacterium]|nr:MAG: cobalt transporter CbiM [Rhodospirillales bacterium]
MHIPDGILPLSLTVAGLAAAAGVTAVSLWRIKARPDPRADVPRAALMTAVFFVASLVHIPVPPTSVHLMLSGLMGMLLGWFAMPAILIGLFFQAVMFGHGGLTTLGVNGVIFGLPALAAFGFLCLVRGQGGPACHAVTAFAAGAGAVMLAVALFTAVLLAGLPAHLDAATERRAILALALAHLPLAVVEGLVVAAVLGFLRRVSPELLRAA